jgi:preprotein translocase subunit SecD
LLRRQQHELQQALASAQSIQPNQPEFTVPRLKAPPFQLQLVADHSGENTLEMTNISSGANGEAIQVNTTSLMDYTAIRSATVTKGSASGEPEINIEFNEEGRDLLAAITRENLNKRLAIVMNGQVYAAPMIRSEIADGKAQITGRFSEQEANQLVAQINESIRYQ